MLLVHGSSSLIMRKSGNGQLAPVALPKGTALDVAVV